MAYRCQVCGELHEDLPALGADHPWHWYDVPAEERAARIEDSTDLCIIDQQHYFIRGVLEIPLTDAEGSLAFGVWVSQKRENFETYRDNPESAEIGPFFNWLCTHLANYPQETLLLKTRARFRGAGLRPTIELEPTSHPLAVDQREGIALARAWEIVHFHAVP